MARNLSTQSAGKGYKMARLKYKGQGEYGSHNFETNEGLQFHAYIDDGIPTPQPDQVVDIEMEERQSKQGKQYKKIVSINGQRGTGRPSGGFQRGGGGRGAPAYDPRTFVSNVVGQAIAHGIIKNPTEIEPWATTAYKVVQGLGPASVKAEVSQADPTPSAPSGASAPPAPSPLGNDDIPF